VAGACAGKRYTFAARLFQTGVVVRSPDSEAASQKRAGAVRPNKRGVLGWVEVLLRRRRKGQPRPGEAHDHHHRDVQGGSARAAVFGISDGLVTNISLILGLSGANPPAGVIRLAGLAGLLGGAFSMAAGEYISMRAQTELFQRELERERQEIDRRPEGELQELVKIYESRGISNHLALQVAKQMMSDPEIALETHAREELGIHPDSLGRPLSAAAASFVTFSVGAVLPLVPFLIGHGTSAVLVSIATAAVAAVMVGSALSLFTGRSWWWSAFRQLAICAAAGAVTYAVGAAVGLSTVH
jgi:VIT1/CCC1 family predicted Fe2+/Mn2+ transporter